MNTILKQMSGPKKADLIGQFRSLAVGFSIENKGYIGTGNAAFILKDFYEYCPG